MRFEFKLPDIGEGVIEGEIVRWLAQEGEVIEEDQPIVEVQTDKASVEIPAPKGGQLARQHFAVGAICPVGEVLVTIETAETPETADSKEAVTSKGKAATPAPEVGATGGNGASAPAVVAPKAPSTSRSRRVRTSPATRKLARGLGVDLGSLEGTGAGGRVTREDVQRAANGPARSGPAPAPAPKASPPADAGPDEIREPLRGVRRVIAETMRRAKDRAAHFTYVEEIDCAELVAIRDKLKPVAAERGVRLTYLPFIIKACVQGLRAYPTLNAFLDDARQEIVIRRRFHIGVAAATERGLMVPVVRDADRKTLVDLAAELQGLSDRARAGKLQVEELRGSTFTITSLGAIGGVLATPIVNDPEVAILGVHQMKDRAVVRDGEIVIRPIMNLACSFDHRLIDGHVGAAFVQVIRTYLEEPARLLLDLH